MRHSSHEGSDAGFAALDALMALTITGLLLAIALNSTVQALRSSRAALDRRLGSAEAEYRLVVEWPRLATPGRISGVSDDHRHTWALTASLAETAATGVDAPSVCAVSTVVTTQDSRRTYRLDTMRFCKPQKAADAG